MSKFKSSYEELMEKLAAEGRIHTVDMSEVWAENERRQKERAEFENEQRRNEVKRINAIVCPVCKSTDKFHHQKFASNGVIGPGCSSWQTENYLICNDCGVHYSDLKK